MVRTTQADHATLFARTRSWADVAAKNAPPPSEQPKPNPNLLEHASTTSDSGISSDNDKVQVVTREEFEAEKAGLEIAEDLEASGTGSEPAVLLTERDAPAKLPAASTNAAPTSKATKSTTADKNTSAASDNSAAASKDAPAKKKDLSKAAKEAKADMLEELKDSDKTLEDEAADAKAKAGAKYDQVKADAKKEYDNLSAKAKSAYDDLTEAGREDWHKLSKEAKKRWEQAKDSEVGKEVQRPEVWGSLLGIGVLHSTCSSTLC